MSYKQQMTSTSVKVIWAGFGSIFTRLTRNLLIFNPCAQDETRTHTILRPLPPQSSVYTNFTTCAECPEQDSNLHTSRHAHLKRTRLPIPPSGQKKRAENETRTRDPDLGKVVLYQLSYFRNFFLITSLRSLLSLKSGCKSTAFF